MTSPHALTTLDPTDIKALLDQGKAQLIDVREPHEFEAEKIHGAINLPLSLIAELPFPDCGTKTPILQCAGGIRSAKAFDLCQQLGHPVAHHMGGGINAWKAQKLPTTR